MKRFLITYLGCITGILLLISTASCFATEQYEYEQNNTAEKKKQYITKLDQDKRKCELAIINTRTLIARSKNRPYLPELYLRLAELYIEKSRIVYFLRKSRQEKEKDSALNNYEANMLKQQAIEIYQRILDHFPEFEFNDKVHFFLAHEYRELGQIKEMIAEYKKIISDFKESQYVAESHLLLGDYYFNQKQDLDNSEMHYKAVLNYPQSPAVAIARYKLAWCRINQVDYKGALELFEESVTSARAFDKLDIDTYRRVDVRLESLVDMAYCYPEVHKKATSKEALQYFRRYAWSRPVYTTVLEKLAYRYFVKKQWEKASGVYRQLAVLRQDPEKLLEYAKNIFQCVQAIGTYKNAEKDVAIIIRALQKQKYSVHLAAAEKERIIKDYELYARDIITHLHTKARKSNSMKDFHIAADAYKQYLDFFTQSPVKEEMASNYAEALFSSHQYLEAGKQYEKIAPAATANRKVRKQMLYSATISYYQALKNKETLSFYQAAYARDGLKTTGNAYAKEYPRSKKTPDVRFNVAWVSYDAGHYETAIKDFTNFVNTYPNHKGTQAAVHLVLDAFYQIENQEGLISYGKSIIRSAKITNKKLKQEVAQIVRSAESRVVSTMTMAALDDWQNARQELMQIADQGGSSTMGEQALNALILTSKDNKDLTTLYDASNKMIKKYPNSSHVQETLGILIDTSIKIGQFRLLADYLESFAAKFPKNENTPGFLLQVAQIREGLGQYKSAGHHYRRAIAKGQITADQYEQIVFAMADSTRTTSGNNQAIKILEKYHKQLGTGSKVRAYALLADMHLQEGRRSQARKYAQLARKKYTPALGRQDSQIRDAMAQMMYGRIVQNSGPYLALKLKNKINNKIVNRKAKLLQQLEDGYQEVMGYKSPAWALRACYRANELNREFADFIQHSPLPADLSEAQKTQYKTILQQKAQTYRDKADQYLQTCVQLAKKWEVCDPQLVGYFIPNDNPKGREGEFSPLATGHTSSEIAAQALRDQKLAELYKRLIQNPDDPETLLTLSKTYLQHGDFRQAALIAQNTLAKLNGSQTRLKADIYNLLGVTHLHNGNDRLAKDAFEKALDANKELHGAQINLAGIYKHYGHEDKAVDIYQQLKSQGIIEAQPDSVHPRTGELFYAYVNSIQ